MMEQPMTRQAARAAVNEAIGPFGLADVKVWLIVAAVVLAPWVAIGEIVLVLS